MTLFYCFFRKDIFPQYYSKIRLVIKIKFQFLGTSAAEGWPALFCKCVYCEKARLYGGRNIRTRSQTIINDDLLIDFPADTLHHFITRNLDMSKVKNILITHSHGDHYHPDDLAMALPPFAHGSESDAINVINLYGNEAVNALKPQFIKNDDVVKYNLVKTFNPFDTGDYLIEPVKADHDRAENCLFYIINDKKTGKRILHGNDTGYFPEETWDYLIKNNRKPFDFVSLDTTCILLPGRSNHMDIKTVCEVRDRMLSESLSLNETIFCMNHFSHNGKLIYDELVPEAFRAGFIVSYDGMIVMI